MNDESALEGNEKLGATAGVAGVEASGANGSAPVTVSAVLRAAADLIEPEGRWTQDAIARDANGDDLDDLYLGEISPQAVCWCAAGAIWRTALGGVGRLAGVDLATSAANAFALTVGMAAPYFNDAPTRTQAEVVAALRKAADLADGVPAARPLADAGHVPGIIE